MRDLLVDPRYRSAGTTVAANRPFAAAFTVASTTASRSTSWQGRRVALASLDDAHFEQELDNSCVAAATRNMIYMLTGTPPSEVAIRDSLARMLGDPQHDFNVNGIHPRYAVNVLKAYGISAVSREGLNIDELVAHAAGDRPMLVGVRAPYYHRLMLDRVRMSPDREPVFYLRNSKTYGGEVTVYSRAEFAAIYNPEAIVIIPTAISTESRLV